MIGDDHPDTLVYLALPPSCCTRCSGAGDDEAGHLGRGGASRSPSAPTWPRRGSSTRSCASSCPEPTIFRIDHFLSNELVRRIVTLRFLNRVFEPVLNAMHVERVDISWLESLTLEGRASYYDGAGALKDMVQNHLMEAMALVLMEQPARIDADSFRDVRVEALRAVATPSAERHAHATRSAPGTPPASIGTRQVPSYVDEPGVDPGRNTETYASLTLDVNSPRWAGVPFTLRSGKALAADSAEIAIHFRPLPALPARPVARRRAERARLGLTDPYVRLATTLNGPERTAENRQLEARSTPPRFDGLRPPDPPDAAERPDAVHPRRRGRGGLAHHRPRHGGVGGRRRPDAGVRRRSGATRSRRLSPAAPGGDVGLRRHGTSGCTFPAASVALARRVCRPTAVASHSNDQSRQA